MPLLAIAAASNRCNSDSFHIHLKLHFSSQGLPLSNVSCVFLLYEMPLESEDYAITDPSFLVLRKREASTTPVPSR
eukprot:1148692-Pelagomonas_calceolata.AAC.2